MSNWPLLWERLREECEGPELVWHSRAREELLSALLAELEALEEAGPHRPTGLYRGPWALHAQAQDCACALSCITHQVRAKQPQEYSTANRAAWCALCFAQSWLIGRRR